MAAEASSGERSSHHSFIMLVADTLPGGFCPSHARCVLKNILEWGRFSLMQQFAMCLDENGITRTILRA